MSTVIPGKWGQCVQEMGTWYANNINTYGTKQFFCPLVGKKVQSDCIGLVCACLQHYGIKMGIYGSSMIANEPEFTNIVTSNGFQKLVYDKSILKPGDILAVYKRVGTKLYHHAEIYEHGKLSWTWGRNWNVSRGGLPNKFADYPYQWIFRNIDSSGRYVGSATNTGNSDSELEPDCPPVTTNIENSLTEFNNNLTSETTQTEEKKEEKKKEEKKEETKKSSIPQRNGIFFSTIPQDEIVYLRQYLSKWYKYSGNMWYTKYYGGGPSDLEKFKKVVVSKVKEKFSQKYLTSSPTPFTIHLYLYFYNRNGSAPSTRAVANHLYKNLVTELKPLGNFNIVYFYDLQSNVKGIYEELLRVVGGTNRFAKIVKVGGPSTKGSQGAQETIGYYIRNA